MGKPRIADLAPASTELLAIPVASITGTVVTIETPHSEPAFRFEVTENHTEAGFTLVRNGVSKPLTMPNGDAVTELTTETMFYDVVEKASAFYLAPKGAKLIGDAQPTDVLVGKTFMNVDGEQIGLGDVDLIPSNIKSGVNIFGVTGNVVPTKYARITSVTYGAGYIKFNCPFTPLLLVGSVHRVSSNYYSLIFMSALDKLDNRFYDPIVFGTGTLQNYFNVGVSLANLGNNNYRLNCVSSSAINTDCDQIIMHVFG